YPGMGTVGFGSGLQSWGFTIERFAMMYMKKFGIKKDQMMKKLWGDSFFNPSTKKWIETQYTEEYGCPPASPLRLSASSSLTVDPVIRACVACVQRQETGPRLCDAYYDSDFDSVRRDYER